MTRLLMAAVAGLAMVSLSACRTSCGDCWGGAALPDLKGEWGVATYSHHHAQHGYLSVSDPSGKWTITEQRGKHFHGERVVIRKGIDGKEFKEGFSGVISADNTRVYIVDHEEDVVIGDIIAEDEMALYILGKTYQDEKPRAGYIVLKKSR